MANGMCRIPVVGYMVKGDDGEYHLDEERSTWADIPADDIARFFIEKLGPGFWKKEEQEIDD